MKLNQITKDNIRDFIQGNWLAWKDKLSSGGIKRHTKEQALFRAMQCPDCLSNGRCLECGCRTPNLFFAPLKRCKLERWGRMLEHEEDWKIFKNQLGIEIPEDEDFNKIKENNIKDDGFTE